MVAFKTVDDAKWADFCFEVMTTVFNFYKRFEISFWNLSQCNEVV